MSDQPPLRVGVLGAGIVGREVALALIRSPERFAPTDGRRIELVGVAVRDVDRHAGGDIPDVLLTDAPAHLVADPEVDTIVELMGGDEPAHTLIAVALAAGKSVVTANKHVLAHHGPELEAIARRTGATLRFEAAVGGGIPILGLLGEDLAANRIDRVRGVVNGTTNYILSAMARDGSDYAEVLAAAQSAGFAEADPRGDVEGDDAVNKVTILTRLAFDTWLTPGSIPRRPPNLHGSGLPGIVGVTVEELAAAAALGLTIRLIASAGRLSANDEDRNEAGNDARNDGGDEREARRERAETARDQAETARDERDARRERVETARDRAEMAGDEREARPQRSEMAGDEAAMATDVFAAVLPTAVPIDGPFGQTTGVLNRIEIDARPLGRVAVSGAGAGGGPTSSAVLGDLLAVARGRGSTWGGLPPARGGSARESARRSPLRIQQGVGSCGWFAYLPGIRPRSVRAGEAHLYAVAAPGGIAIRSAAAPLDLVRSSVARLVDASASITLYPIDE
ncbi:MAG TPA: homoserine dehydrogenase [Candidatus Saccharimonadales bacterium]|nr:homoserine dehydrogenase [Candidatus Saccharimonadales bacterium]